MRFRWAIYGLLLLLAYHPVSAQQTLAEREGSRIETIRQISPSVVCVMASSGEGGGSGVLISSDGLCISNYHVTSGSGNFMKCGLNDGRVYDAVIMGIDPTGDVALIQLLGRTDFATAVPGNSDFVRAGDEVMALGNPFLLASDFSPTVTWGIVSGVHRYQYPANTFLEYTDCIQIDASINPGNSGGPLFDISGKWIGINGRASFEKRGRVHSGAAYAISVNQVLRFVDHLRAGLIVDHGRTDFTVETGDNDEVQVSQVSELSEAWRRGLRPGAVLLTFAGRSLTSANDFQNILGTWPEGTRLPYSWRDEGGVHSATVRLSPLHSFTKAPELPAERRPPRPERMPEDSGELSPTEDQLPEEIQKLFVQKEGFCNYYFNEQQRAQLLNPLRTRTQPVEAYASTWQIRFQQEGSTSATNGELAISPETVGLRIGDSAWLQQVDNPKTDEEPAAMSGLLIAMNQLRRLFSTDATALDEITAFGTTVHLPLGKTCRVLLSRQGIRTGRWYFDAAESLPIAVDLDFETGQDEIRLIFENWKDWNNVIFPERIGIVNATTEEVSWLRVTDAARQN